MRESAKVYQTRRNILSVHIPSDPGHVELIQNCRSDRDYEFRITHDDIAQADSKIMVLPNGTGVGSTSNCYLGTTRSGGASSAGLILSWSAGSFYPSVGTLYRRQNGRSFWTMFGMLEACYCSGFTAVDFTSLAVSFAGSAATVCQLDVYEIL